MPISLPSVSFLPGPASSQVGFALGVLHGDGLLGGLAAWFAFTLPPALILCAFPPALLPFRGQAVDGILQGLKLVDDGRMIEAARAWFILQYFGVEAFLLNGGWRAIRGSEDLLATAAPSRPAMTFRAHPGSGTVGFVSRQTLKADLGSDVRVLDARTAGEFTGEDLRRNARGGRLPGARLVLHSGLLDNGRLNLPRNCKIS